MEQQLLERFVKALNEVKKLDAEVLGEQETKSMTNQLEFVIGCLKRGVPIKTDKEFNFGLYAVRDIRDANPDLARELAELGEWVDAHVTR